MSIDRAVLVVVTRDPVATPALVAALGEAGAHVRVCHTDEEALSSLRAPDVDVAILDVHRALEPFGALRSAMSAEAGTRDMPIVAIVDGALTVRDTACLAPSTLVAREQGMAGLLAGIDQAVSRASRLRDSVRHAQGVEQQLRAALQRLGALRGEIESFGHDARVLCGVVIGFGANLRDGIVGPLQPMQHDHALQMLEATQQIVALMDRYTRQVHIRTEIAVGLAPPTTARVVVCRNLTDFASLVRTTVGLFESMAAWSSISLDVVAPDAIEGWCDAMQIKQVVTNLLVNALKFTPAGGRVRIEARRALPQVEGGVLGPDARAQVEILVDDSGPGIPDGDRERIFERGVRLARDAEVAGSGIGLSVVREIVSRHGGRVRASNNPEGGASFVISLPIDMRARRDRGILLIDDADAAKAIVRVLADAASGLEVKPARSEANLVAAIASCLAVVVTARDGRVGIEELLRAHDSAAPSARGPAAGRA